MSRKYNHRKVKAESYVGKEIAVTMTRTMYNEFMKDKRDDKGHVIERGFKNDDELMNYINRAWGLLGTVVEIRVED